MIQVANVKQQLGVPIVFIEVRNYPNRIVNIPNNFKPIKTDFIVGTWKIKYLR
jgi:hypothetical protein